MPAAPVPDDELQRLRALDRLRILDTERAPEFDLFADLASKTLGAPMAAVVLVAQDRQWFKASVGLDMRETPRACSFGAYALLEGGDVLHVPDATQDRRFADNALVTGPMAVRAYAGARIVAPGGEPIGALCVIDTVPRRFTPEELGRLQLLAAGVSNTLRLHQAQLAATDRAMTDPLTGLLNRAGFTRAMHAAVPGAVLSLDLDDFRVVNTLYGHAGGDAVLHEVGSRLHAAALGGEVIARLGGDQFAVLASGEPGRAAVSELCRRIHAALAEPFAIGRLPVTLQTSIGVAVRSEGVGGVGGADGLLQAADVALAQAKRAGRQLTRFAERPATLVCSGREAIRERLRQALLPPGREPFALEYQPVFSAGGSGRDATLCGFEALVRWPNGAGGTLQPADFIPQAEATGLIVELDRWSLDRACREAAAWPAPLYVAANLSAANFFAGDLVGDVAGALRRHRLAPERLRLEITETVLLCGRDRVRQVIQELRAIGVRVVLDDFGAGYASLAYLRDYPFAGVKIDRSFVTGLASGSRNQAFVDAMLGLARALEIETTAEGVETPEQLSLLTELEVSSLQGYLLGRPMPGEAVLRLIGHSVPRVSALAGPAIRDKLVPARRMAAGEDVR